MAEDRYQLPVGLIQVYTGNAKGKSTAAFGLAIRGVGHGLRVSIVQFMKTGSYGENETFARYLPQIKIRSFGRKGFIKSGGATPEDYILAAEAMKVAKEDMLSGEWDILILDEINNALFFGLVTLEEVMNLLTLKPQRVEVVLTGRNAPKEIKDCAHLVTEMVEVKHPYQQNIPARKGIEY